MVTTSSPAALVVAAVDIGDGGSIGVGASALTVNRLSTRASVSGSSGASTIARTNGAVLAGRQLDGELQRRLVVLARVRAVDHELGAGGAGEVDGEDEPLGDDGTLERRECDHGRRVGRRGGDDGDSEGRDQPEAQTHGPVSRGVRPRPRRPPPGRRRGRCSRPAPGWPGCCRRRSRLPAGRARTASPPVR